MKTAEDHICETSQRELAAGILNQAAQDLRRFHDATSVIERELYFDAYSWVMSHDCSWPFSFLNVCKLLNRAPETVRQELLGDMPLGVFGYLSRRCTRAARRLQIFLANAFTSEPNPSPPKPVTTRALPQT